MRIVVTVFLFLFSLISNAQDSLKLATKSYSFVKNEKIKDFVYRGIQNPISINVLGAKSFIASGLGLKRVNDKYYLTPGQGLKTEIRLEITLQNDSIVHESHFFEIKSIKHLLGSINGKNCFIKLTKDEFLNGIITYEIPDFEFDINRYNVISFDILIGNNRKTIIGNKIPNNLKIRKESRIRIENINIENPLNICLIKIYPIEIIIID